MNVGAMDGWQPRSTSSTPSRCALEDLNQLNDHLVYCNLITGDTSNMAKLKISELNWLESVIVASLWIGVFLGIACTWFSFKDY